MVNESDVNSEGCKCQESSFPVFFGYLHGSAIYIWQLVTLNRENMNRHCIHLHSDNDSIYTGNILY